MSYRVLARAYRSNTFDEIVGQDAIATTLKNAITSGRVHHGYLFMGTRGVGKTSMARILAKSLNCLAVDEPTVTPCCRCDSCTAVAEGEDIDVVEIDAASNRGIDNIRELRSNAGLRPARARFKIYIIDEVHMLTTEAFNALLKTLEEPPPHVKFMLATTEAQKVPATILSRCQRFDFLAIGPAAIAEHLARILDVEKVKVEEAVLKRLARLANGSMRDALSLLDKLLSYEPENLTAELLDTVLPPPHHELAHAVIDAVASRDAAAALTALDAALQGGQTVDRFCDHLIAHLHTLMIMRVAGGDTELVDVAEHVREVLAEQAQRFDPPTYVYMMSLLEQLRRNVKYTGAGRPLADATVVRLAMSRQFTDINDLIARLDTADDAPPASKPAASAGEPSRESPGRGARHEPASARSGGATRANATGTRRGSAPSSDATAPGEPIGRGHDDRTGTAPDAVAAPQATPPRRTARRRRSVKWQDVAADPLVQRVRDAVDGTLFDVRPVAGPMQPDVGAGASGAPGADPVESVTTEPDANQDSVTE